MNNSHKKVDSTAAIHSVLDDMAPKTGRIGTNTSQTKQTITLTIPSIASREIDIEYLYAISCVTSYQCIKDVMYKALRL